MSKFLIIASLFLATLLPSNLQAQTVPSDVQTMLVTMGDLINENQAPMTYQGKTIMVQLDYCQAAWNTNDTFYVFHKTGSPYFAMRKTTLDTVLTAANNDWNVAFKAMMETKQICALTIAVTRWSSKPTV